MVGLIGAFVALLSGVASAANPITLKIPCDVDPFLRCVDLKKKLIEGSTGTADKQFGFRATVKDVMKDIYEGKIKAAADAAPGSGSCTTLNLVGKPPFCPPIPIPENGCRDEFLVNALNETCAPISRVGPKGDGKYYFTLGRGASGSLETATVAGGLIVAVSNFAIPLEAEIAKNELKIDPSSPCYSNAMELENLIRAQNDVKLLEEVKRCDVSNTETCSTKKYFQAALSTMMTSYITIARCRLADEASRSFRDFADTYQTRIENNVWKNCFYQGGTPAEQKSCYRRKYETWIKAGARAAFPNAAAACVNGPTGESTRPEVPRR
jgi:hypothetical protein